MEKLEKAKIVIDSYVLASKLKDVIRTGWKDWNVQRERLESVAEHIYGVQMLAIFMYSEYEYKHIDICKAIFMIAIHELEEIFIGDLTQWQITKQEKKRKGQEAVANFLKNITLEEYIMDTIKEHDEKSSPLSIFVYQCDKLECDLQSKLYDEEGTVDLSNQENNVSFNDERVQKLLKQEKTWSGMWLTFGQQCYPYDQNFLEVSNYAKTNKIKFQ